MHDRAPARIAVAAFVCCASLGAFVGSAWAAIALIAALGLCTTVGWTDRRMPRPAPAFAWLAAASLLCLTAKLPFDPWPFLSAHMDAQLTSIFVPFLFLTSPRLQTAGWSRHLLTWTALAMACGALTLSAELSSGGAMLHALRGAERNVTDYNRGAAHLVILTFPLLGGLWIAGRIRPAIALAAILLIPAMLTESHTSKLALLGGLAAVAAARASPRATVIGLAGIALALVPWPFYARHLFAARYDAIETWHDSWRHRMEIWDYLSFRIADRPWLGWGLGSTHLLDHAQPDGGLYRIVTGPAAHAHNLFVELWVETGVPGLLCGCAFLLLSLRAAWRTDARLRPFALGGWTAALIIALFGFDFWTDALWAAFAMTGFLFGIVQQAIQRGENLGGVQHVESVGLQRRDPPPGRA